MVARTESIIASTWMHESWDFPQRLWPKESRVFFTTTQKLVAECVASISRAITTAAAVITIAATLTVLVAVSGVVLLGCWLQVLWCARAFGSSRSD